MINKQKAAQRLAILAIKHCPKDNYDWKEVKELSYLILPDQLVSNQTDTSCPKCGSTNFDAEYWEGSYAVPECTYLLCDDCHFQWMHE